MLYAESQKQLQGGSLIC